MAMTVKNNPTATLVLGELNKNVSKLGKQLSKVANGQKIVSAGDGTADQSMLAQANQNSSSVLSLLQ